jgi:PEP-CTERM motif
MKKKLLAVILCGITAASLSLVQAQQALSFTGPTDWVPGTQVTLSVDLTFAGYNAIGLGYWLDASGSIAPFLTITGLTHFTFPVGYNGPFPVGIEAIDLGGDTMPGVEVAPGTYHVTDVMIAVAANAPIGSYMLLTATSSPRASAVVDASFQDHLIPSSQFAFNVVPEPGSLALLGLGAIASRERRV